MKYLRRALWFVFCKLLLVSVVAGLLTITFYLAMNTSNFYILLSDGLEARVGVVLNQNTEDDLSRYFTREFLDADPVLAAVHDGVTPYQDYTIRGFDHRVTVLYSWCWPWEDTAQVKITERVPFIDGELPQSLKTQEQIAMGGKVLPPQWRGGYYDVTLVRQNGQWRITNLSQTDVIIEPTIAPSSSPDITFSPEVAP